jgi:hypothetical protein
VRLRLARQLGVHLRLVLAPEKLDLASAAAEVPQGVLRQHAGAGDALIFPEEACRAPAHRRRSRDPLRRMAPGGFPGRFVDRRARPALAPATAWPWLVQNRGVDAYSVVDCCPSAAAALRDLRDLGLYDALGLYCGTHGGYPLSSGVV